MDRDIRSATVEDLRRLLPLCARPRPALLAMIRRAAPDASASSVLVTSVFDDATHGIMCRIEWRDQGPRAPVLVASLTQLRFARASPCEQENRIGRRKPNTGLSLPDRPF